MAPTKYKQSRDNDCPTLDIDPVYKPGSGLIIKPVFAQTVFTRLPQQLIKIICLLIMHKFVCLLFIVARVMLHLKQLRGDIFSCKPSSNNDSNDNVKQKFNSSDVLTLNIISTWWHKPTHFQLTCSSSNAICNSNTCKRHYKWNYHRRFGDCTFMVRHIFMATRLLYHAKHK